MSDSDDYYESSCPCGNGDCPCGDDACDLGCCSMCGYHTTSICLREGCGGDGCMEFEGCTCDCAFCNTDYNGCYCKDKNRALPEDTLMKLSLFQAVFRSIRSRCT